mmetsp:Transcript_4252/g.9208  ORF Transcript_4252/g.9208 Transcript_4252/m.9208 type:complete len:93 (+) Transcript_4252:324-602(+)
MKPKLVFIIDEMPRPIIFDSSVNAWAEEMNAKITWGIIRRVAKTVSGVHASDDILTTFETEYTFQTIHLRILSMPGFTMPTPIILALNNTTA